jgi:hypothetical protein
MRSRQSLNYSRFRKMLWNPKVHYRVHKSPPLVPILRQINLVRSTPSYLSKIHFNIILPSTTRSFPLKSYMHSSSHHACYMPWPFHSPWHGHSNCTWWRVQLMKLLIMQFLQPPVTSSLFGPNILLSILFSYSLGLCSFLTVRDQVSHPYNLQEKL